uniref:FMRFamide-like neuropeptide RYIRF-amide n=1 Tax=Arthurdendyus triangulatus TaxID=132421 RepID=FARP_ARTTR
RYIRF